MTNKNEFIRTLMLLCVLFTAQRSWADDFMQKNSNYTAMMTGVNKVTFTLPTQRWSAGYNEGLQEGYVYVSVDGGSLEKVFAWGLGDGYRNMTSTKESGKVSITAYQGGMFELKGKVKTATRTSFTAANGTQTYTLAYNDDDDDHFSTTVEWTVPRTLRGKNLKLYVWAHVNWGGAGDWHIPNSDDNLLMLDWACPDAGQASVTINQPMVAYDAAHVNLMMFPYSIVANKVDWAKIHYTDAVTGQSYETTLGKNMADMAYIPADRPWKDVYIEASLTDVEGVKVETPVESDHISAGMLHHPRNLSATVNQKGQAVLTWTVDNADMNDLSNEDMFEIQRNLTGSTSDDDAYWSTISMEQQFVQNKTTYTYTDENLLSSYTGNPVSYRIRRSSTSMWTWSKGDGHATFKLPTLLCLPTIYDGTAQRSTWNDEVHTVAFNYNIGNVKYDREGRFIVRNDSEWKELQELVGKNQMNYSNAVMVLLGKDDWMTFAKRVNDGATGLNAVMLNNIDLGDSQVAVGKNGGKAYEGTFNGLGHTLTVNYTPFNVVGNATIKNLIVDGTITSTSQSAAGLIYMVESNKSVEIDYCLVKVDITNQYKGGSHSGGFIGSVYNNSKVAITNSAFTGSVQGEKSIENGGFIGSTDSGCDVKMKNCLFSPVSLPFYQDGCATFVRKHQSATLTLENCYYTMVYGKPIIDGKAYYVIRSDKDWHLFKEMVEQSNKGQWIGAVLGADITVTEMIGTEAKPYYGAFNGNGHTLTVNIETTEWGAAPFHIVGDVLISNLHVAGSVKGDIHTSGLIGGRVDSPTINIEKVWVSANVTTTSSHVAGIIGHAGSATVNISDTRFEGQITANGSNDTYAGAIIGWGGEYGRWTMHRVYDYSTFEGVYWRFFSINTPSGRWDSWGSNGESTLTVTRNIWDNVKYYNMSKQEDVRSLMNSEKSNSWQLVDGRAVPVMTSITLSDGEGTSAVAMSLDELRTALGEGQWYFGDGSLKPVMESTADNSYGSALWDNRAKLHLRINMHGEKGVESQIVDLSGNEDAINKHQFTHELSRKCVEYSFDLLLLRGSSPCKISGTERDTLVIPLQKTDQGDLANYRFQNSDRITKFTPTKKQSSVELNWETAGGEHDYFRVLRRQHSNDATAAWTDTLATDLTQLFYEDKSVLVQQSYDYRVESVWQCEGTHIESLTCTGQCEPTGMISGYVRMADGTAIGGAAVECRPDGVIPGANSLYTTVTDEAGFFEFKGLPFQGTGRYNVTVPTTGDAGNYTGPNDKGEVVFSANSNWTRNFNFFMDTYFVYSGHIYYRDTSIPVPGVSFKLDGKVMHDASQKAIVTDTQGAFALSIPKGEHSVQAVKEGHAFAEQGFLVNLDALDGKDKYQYNFVKNVSNAYLWDTTTVVLRGRVVGGDVEGSKPLGQGLSKNNLGDSIKIVMQLEGDNASYLIRKQDDETVKSASYDVSFGPGGKSTTHVDVTRHSLTIRPDAKTGEYELSLPPVKYKVIEVSAQGYVTLFQQGKVGETLDLTFNAGGDTCEYSRIYHSEPTVMVRQFNPGGEDYFGVKKMNVTDVIGHQEVVNIFSYKKDSPNATDSTGVYSFGYPVFMSGSPYGFTLQACEKYYKNNNPGEVVDVVNLKGGKVKIQNYLIGNEWDNNKVASTVTLDEDGGGSYVFTPYNTTFALEGDNALKTVDITFEYDSCFYDIKPFGGKVLKGYVMATTPKREGRKSIVSGTPKLFDILRDPPGGSSFSYIEEGSKMSYGYSADFNASLGFNFHLTKGENMNWYSGAVLVPAGGGMGKTDGTYTSSSKSDVLNLTPTVSFGQSWNYSYNIDVTERIQTQSGKKWVGPKADLFIGMTENVIVQDAIAVRVVPQSMYDIVRLHAGGTYTTADGVTVKVPVGTTKVLAEGQDAGGNKVYLVRDEVITASPAVKSTFIHSQHYIENELLPELIKIRNSLLLPKNVADDKAQALADSKGTAVYVSEVGEDEDYYGFKYNIFWPNKAKPTYVDYLDDQFETGDSIAALNQEVVTWIGFLAQNEEEKLNVLSTNLVKRYDFDGGAANIQYSENFTTGESGSRYLRYPLINGLGNLGNTITGVLGVFFKNVLNFKELGKGEITNTENIVSQDEQSGTTKVSLKFQGYTLDLKVNVIATINMNDKFNYSSSRSKKAGFTLAASSKSSMTVDVYRTVANKMTLPHGADASPYYNLTYEGLENLRTGKLTPNSLNYLKDTTKVYSNFVFRTVGGVTCEPYEAERATKWYQPGMVLDVATIPADKPNIWIDEPVKSNVPYNEPARFKLHFANESDYPERASLVFNYYLLASSNPDGAKVYVDGTPINSEGVNITLYPCRDPKTGAVTVFTKEIEVYPGQGFDYNDLTLCLYDPEDANRVFSTKFSAHFVPTAGKVNVSVPGNNWVMNTESPYDGKRHSRYMPVRIDGFDTNYRGFDHIELQYKLSTQGDKDWVSVCSFYKDRALMEKASGVTDTIPESGVIVARFYGEDDPIEQYYDLRAVNYCRHAGGFLTGTSEILKGIKDTRLPVVFGTPQPSDGILGIGDDILIKFSEPIAGNYLRGINNFEVLGSLVSNDVSTSTSLNFTGTSGAISQGSRTLSGKSFTVDVMLNPLASTQMTVFSHGGEEKGLRFGLTAEGRLMADINGQTVESDSVVKFNNALHEVAYALDQSGSNMTVHFFDGSKAIGSKTLKGKYEGSSPLKIGYDIDSDDYYRGDMLEFRLWNRALTGGDGGDLSMYGKKKLTGYESGLLDYYPMNEGEGVWAYDKAPGSMDLMLSETSWKRPAGISMAMKGDKGIVMKPEKFARGRQHDYTLTFWFRTSDMNNTLFSNGEANAGQTGQINIGIKNDKLYVRSAGFEKNTSVKANDGRWHHFAMTVSRSQNVANIYMDKKLIDSFAADSLSGIEGDHIALGATYAEKNTPTRVMTGNIDEIGMFSSVLPPNLIAEYSNHTPLGTMSAMMAYLDFGSSKKTDQNLQHLEPTGVSLKRYVDSQGKVLERRDTLLADGVVEAFADRNVFAPMVSNSQLDNLNYSFVANDNELYVDITEPDFMVEKTNVYVTVKEVSDLQGNLMASPLTMNIFVYRNPLRWDVKHIDRDMQYGMGLTFEATVKNQSGMTQNYRLEDLPVWISASQTSGTVNALDEQTITFKVSPYINIGTYDEQLSLIGDDNMSEPLPITLRVRGEEPEWEVSEKLKQMNQTMMMVARVKIDGVVANSEEDMLAVLDENQQVLGMTHIELNENGNANEALAYLIIYGYTNEDGSKPQLDFRFYKASAGSVYRVKPADGTVYTFEKNALAGSATTPVVLEDNALHSVWWIALKKGWNWVSIPVVPQDKTVGEFLNSLSIWEPGDMITAVDGHDVQKYVCREDKTAARGYKWDNEDQPITIRGTQMYNIYSMSDKRVYLEGQFDYRSITAHKDWNRIGYSRNINLPISQAMSDYLEKAREGDVLKSQDAFAIVSMGSNGLAWKGTLQFMEAGKGYMLRRQDDTDATFSYPIYYTDNRYSGNGESRMPRQVSTSTTMNMVAAVAGVETEADDRLVVYSGAERMAEATADDEHNYYLNIGSDGKSGESLTFALERDGEIIAMTGSRISYAPNKVLGTPSQPTTISFTALEQMPHDGKWYNVGGVLIGKKPTRSGVYIHNGKAVVIK